jgi:type I restriction enzyme S subunit
MSFESWKEVKLGDIADILSGYAFKSNEFVGFGVPVVKIKNIMPPIIDITDVQYVSEALFAEKYRFALEYNDILISMTGSNVNQIASAVGKIGRVKLKHTKLLLNQRVGKLYVIDKENCDYEYLYYYLTQGDVRYNLAASAGGSANQANISPNQIKSIKIKIPTLKEQKAIASILSALDDKIELNNRMNKVLEQMAQAVFKQWFVDFEFPNENGEPYKSSGGEVVDTVIGMKPLLWEVKTIGQIVEVTDYVANGSFASLKENVSTSEKIEYAIIIRLVDYNRNFKGLFSYVNEKGYKYLKKSKLIGGEIIISNVGANAGTIFKVPNLNKPMTLGPNSIMLIDNNLSNYLYCILNSNWGKESISGIIGGSAQPKFNKTDFRNIKLVVPQDTLIDIFNSIIQPIVDKLSLLNNEIRHYEELRDTLLPKLMSGEIDVSNIEL